MYGLTGLKNFEMPSLYLGQEIVMIGFRLISASVEEKWAFEPHAISQTQSTFN